MCHWVVTSRYIHQVASNTRGYSPSDIREVLQSAALYPMREARAAAMASTQMNNNGDNNETRVVVVVYRIE